MIDIVAARAPTFVDWPRDEPTLDLTDADITGVVSGEFLDEDRDRTCSYLLDEEDLESLRAAGARCKEIIDRALRRYDSIRVETARTFLLSTLQ